MHLIVVEWQPSFTLTGFLASRLSLNHFALTAPFASPCFRPPAAGGRNTKAFLTTACSSA